MCIDDTYKLIFLFINPCYTILTCSSIAYVNLLVGIITLTSNLLSSGLIPRRLVGVSRLTTTLLKGCLYLYRHLDLGIVAALFDILTHVLRFVSTCTLSSINFMSKIRDVVLSCTERLLQLLSRYLFQLLTTIHEACISIYTYILLPTLNSLRFAIRAVWKNPSVSLFTSVGTMVIVYLYRDKAMRFMEQWKADNSPFAIASSSIFSIQSISVWQAIVISIVNTVIAQVSSTSYALMDVLQYSTVRVSIMYLRSIEATHVWMTDQSLYIVCRQSSFGWVLFILHLLASQCVADSHLWASKAIMKAIYFPLIVLNFMSVYLLDWFVFLLNKNASIAMYGYIAINVLLLMRVYRDTLTNSNDSRHSRHRTTPASSATAVKQVSLLTSAKIQYLQSHTPYHRFDDIDCAICLDPIETAAAAAADKSSLHSLQKEDHSVYLPCGM